MNRLWIKFRMPIAIIGILAMTVVMARLFSGPEDGWIRDLNGEWISHGVPTELPPSEGYSEPATQIIVPLSFFIAFAWPFFIIGLFKSRDRLTYNAIIGDQKLYGYLGMAFAAFGVLTGAGLCVEVLLAAGPSAGLDNLSVLVIGALTGFALFSCMTGMLFFVMKRVSSDHYQLMKSQREIAEKLAALIRQ